MKVFRQPYFGDRRDSPLPSRCTQGWTDDRVEQLKCLWADGLSGTQIAHNLGGVTRNSVIGKAHRLGLHHDLRLRPTPTAERRAPSVHRNTKIANGHNLKADPVTPRLPREPLPTSRDLAPTCDLLGLGAHMCRWPIGDPASPSFGFCGRVTDGTYCTTPSRPDGASHRDRAYQPASATEKDFARGLRRYLG